MLAQAQEEQLSWEAGEQAQGRLLELVQGQLREQQHELSLAYAQLAQVRSPLPRLGWQTFARRCLQNLPSMLQ